MEIDTIKISELAEGTTINNDSILVYNLNGQTKKITFQNLKNAVISALASEVSQLDADLEAEVTARAAADTALARDITAEATARTNADTALAGDISAEASAREAAITLLKNTLIKGIEISGTTDTQGRLLSTGFDISSKAVVGVISGGHGQIALQVRLSNNNFGVKFLDSSGLSVIANTSCSCIVYYVDSFELINN